MNEEVEKTITNSLDGFQWILGAFAVGLILYLVFKSFKKRN